MINSSSTGNNASFFMAGPHRCSMPTDDEHRCRSPPDPGPARYHRRRPRLRPPARAGRSRQPAWIPRTRHRVRVLRLAPRPIPVRGKHHEPDVADGPGRDHHGRDHARSARRRDRPVGRRSERIRRRLDGGPQQRARMERPAGPRRRRGARCAGGAAPGIVGDLSPRPGGHRDPGGPGRVAGRARGGARQHGQREPHQSWVLRLTGTFYGPGVTWSIAIGSSR